MPSGGARAGAGRPKKPLAEKILTGNPGKRELTKIQFPNDDNSNIKKSNTTKSNKSKIPLFLNMEGKEGGDNLPTASEIYTALAAYISSAGCTELVAPHLIEDFAFLRRSYLECEAFNKKHGRIANGKRSPYLTAALDYLKASNSIFNQIWLIISRNCEEPLGEKNSFLELLASRGF